jgi:hypothetical protein
MRGANQWRLTCGILLIAATGWAQGFRIAGDELIVDEGHWQDWNFPQGTVEFDAQGGRPQYVQAWSNLALNAHTFTYGEEQRGGIHDAGTNLDLAARLIDGQDDTYWEPAADSPLEKWWVEIDLGRSAWVQKIVVKFADEDIGDPFLQFNLLTSNGLSAFQQSEALNYIRVGRSEGLNKTQRVFEFDLQPSLDADEGLAGDLIQFVQIVATASDGGQAGEINEARWNSLPQEERGDILYFRREATGVLRQVDSDTYQAIAAAEERGPVRYYRREQPRLAEIEVWSAGDNLSLGALDRGGRMIGFGNSGNEFRTIDGDYSSFWDVQIAVGGGNSVVDEISREIFFDLGAWYWINRVFFVFAIEVGNDGSSNATLPNHIISLSDGTRAPDGSFVYAQLAARGQEGQDAAAGKKFYQNNLFALTKARYVKIDYRLLISRWISSKIREIQLYGRGFLPQVSLTSTMIPLGENAPILSTIAWEADTPPGTQVQIRTRTGNQIEKKTQYFTSAGLEVSEAGYRKTLSFLRGDSLITFVPGPDWSAWSAPYREPGAAITSPSPRDHVMIQATMLSDDPEQPALLRNLRISLQNPLANQIIGEIAPRKVLQGGQRDILSLYLKPVLEANHQGFDQVLVQLPPGAAAKLVDVRVGSENELAADGGRLYGADELEQLASNSDSLWIRLPEPVRDPQDLVALRFSSLLYLVSNEFIALVGMGEDEEKIWQRVDAGDATALVEGSGMAVQIPLDGGLLGEMEVGPNPFTPNGDGINDLVEFAFPVFKIQGQKSLLLEVYNLSGRLLLRHQNPAVHAAGLQRLTWDGRDDSGKLSPPGLYICRVGVDVDAEDVGRSTVARLISLVY